MSWGAVCATYREGEVLIAALGSAGQLEGMDLICFLLPYNAMHSIFVAAPSVLSHRDLFGWCVLCGRRAV